MGELVRTDAQEIMEAVISKGDLSKLTPAERNTYYDETCRSVGLNPLTRPFEYLVLQGKTTLYARKDATEQLRKIHGVSIKILAREIKDGMIIVHVQAIDKTGREDEDLGVIPAASGAADIRANQMMKAITKAKRRVTLSICGLGFPDESEIEDMAKEENKAPRKTKTITSAEKPKELPPSDNNSDVGDNLEIYQDPRDEVPADTAGDSHSPNVPGESSAGLSQPAQMYAAQLDKAAEQGLEVLQGLWAKLHPRYQKELADRKAEWKATATAADAKKGKKSDTLV